MTAMNSKAVIDINLTFLLSNCERFTEDRGAASDILVGQALLSLDIGLHTAVGASGHSEHIGKLLFGLVLQPMNFS